MVPYHVIFINHIKSVYVQRVFPAVILGIRGFSFQELSMLVAVNDLPTPILVLEPYYNVPGPRTFCQ